MIFVTVGVQLGFDRLIQAMDDWSMRFPEESVFAQIGNGSFIPRYMDCARLLTPEDYADCVRRADLIVAHAGIGSLATALEAGKPLIVMPRQSALSEHRNDHQAEGTNKFFPELGAAVAKDKAELFNLLERRSQLARTRPTRQNTYAQLQKAIADFIQRNHSPHSQNHQPLNQTCK